MKISTFRSLEMGDKVTPINHEPEYVTNQYVRVEDGRPTSYVVLAGAVELGEDKAFLLSDEVIHPQVN